MYQMLVKNLDEKNNKSVHGQEYPEVNFYLFM